LNKIVTNPSTTKMENVIRERDQVKTMADTTVVNNPKLNPYIKMNTSVSK